MNKKSFTLSLADITWLIDSMKLVFPTKEETVNKIDAMNEKLDVLITEIKTTREEQELHVQNHADIHDRIEKIEARVGITPAA